jgi:hypothetical protein
MTPPRKNNQNTKLIPHDFIRTEMNNTTTDKQKTATTYNSNKYEQIQIYKIYCINVTILIYVCYIVVI